MPVVDNKFVRATDLFDPERCQCSTPYGPCPYKVIPGEKFCQMHSGGPVAHKQTKDKERNYRLTKWQERVNEFSDNGQVKSLREEIGLTRMLLEQVANSCHTTIELMGKAGQITDIIMKIKSLVEACHKLELQNNLLLDRGTVLNISLSIVEVVGKYVKEAGVLDKIGEEIVVSIMKNHTIIQAVKG